MPGSDASAPMVRVRLFASLREAAGWAERSVPMDGGSTTPFALWHQLGLGSLGPGHGSDPPGGEPLPGGVRVAINQQFASPHAPLAEGDELAFLPPITGG
jgi:molybdopterin synthase sulfur carrier subunit